MAATTGMKAIADTLRKSNETLTQFAAEWKRLSDSDREQLKEAITSGRMTY